MATGMDSPNPKRRWFYPTPAWLLVGLLAVEGLLWLSERFQWFGFNHDKGWTVLIAVGTVGILLVLMLLWFIAALIFRWRFQFSIRSLLVLVVAVALPFSWLAVEMKKARQQREAVEAFKNMGYASCLYDCQIMEDGTTLPDSMPEDWKLLRSLLSDDFFNDVIEVEIGPWSNPPPTLDSDLMHLRQLPGLKRLKLIFGTDAGRMENLRVLTHLKTLLLGWVDDDAALKES